MINIETIEILISFGLTRQEANIYMLLFAEGELNGYEVSKLTGISRSNAYNALAGLVEKGAAYIIEGNAILYTPVNIEEFCENKIRYMQKSKTKLIQSIPDRRKESDGYITIKSEKHIVDKMRNMLHEAKERVYLSLSNTRLEEVLSEIEELRDRGIKIVIITNPPYKFEGAKVYHHSDKKDDQIRLIVDSKDVLTGLIRDVNNSTCLYSSNNNLVEVFKEALANEIKILEINKEDK